MRVWHVIVIALVAGAGVPVALHDRAHGGVDAGHAALAAFLWLNVIVALWEICLFLRIDLIRAQHERFVVEYRGRPLDRVRDFFQTPVPAGRLFSPSLWAEIWSSYSLFDESYADKRSYGFFVDTGNGFVTLIPSLLFLYGMTFPVLPARALGVVGVALFWQMLYGTLVYFLSFVFHRRWRGHRPLDVALFVGLSNGLWLVGPAWGLVVAVDMVWTGTTGAVLP